LLTSTVSGVLSQRLVRKLCVHCREPYTPDAALIKELKLDRCAKSNDVTLYRPVGCDKCNETGYRGRQSILELLTMSDAIRTLVHEKSSAKQIEMTAIKDGMHTIYQDGCDKALAGITSIDEVLRVIQDG